MKIMKSIEVICVALFVCSLVCLCQSRRVPSRPTKDPFIDFASHPDLKLITDDDDRPPTIFSGDVMKAQVTNVRQLQSGYNFETQNGINIAQIGKLKNADGKQYRVVTGSYSYTAADGKRYRVKYTADETGYHPITELDEGDLPDFPPAPKPTAAPISVRLNVPTAPVSAPAPYTYKNPNSLKGGPYSYDNPNSLIGNGLNAFNGRGLNALNGNDQNAFNGNGLNAFNGNGLNAFNGNGLNTFNGNGLNGFNGNSLNALNGNAGRSGKSLFDGQIINKNLRSNVNEFEYNSNFLQVNNPNSINDNSLSRKYLPVKPEYLPPTQPPKYLPPTQAPIYVPPTEAPKYLPPTF